MEAITQVLKELVAGGARDPDELFEVLRAVLNLVANDFRQVCGDIMHAPWLGARDVVEPVGVLHRAHEEAQSTVFTLIASRNKATLANADRRIEEIILDVWHFVLSKWFM